MAELNKIFSLPKNYCVEAIAFHNHLYGQKNQKGIESKIRLSLLSSYYQDFTLSDIYSFLNALEEAVRTATLLKSKDISAVYTTEINYKKHLLSSPVVRVRANNNKNVWLGRDYIQPPSYHVIYYRYQLSPVYV